MVLGWIALVCVGLDWFGVGRDLLESLVLGWVGFVWIGLVRNGAGWIGLI